MLLYEKITKIFMRKLRLFLVAIYIIIANSTYAQDSAVLQKVRSNINYIIVIYQENWSFDGLFGKFPGCNNLDSAGVIVQTDKNNEPLKFLPRPVLNGTSKIVPDLRFPEKMPVAPYDLTKYVKSGERTGDMVHRFYTNQHQINGGKNDKFVLYSDNGGLVLSYCDVTNMPLGRLASQYTLCDNFFQSAFGGSYLNHIWLVAAATPYWPNAPRKYLSQPDILKHHYRDAQCTPDGFVVNTSYPINHPHPAGIPDTLLVPEQTLPTIGDRLNEKNISWAYYSGGWSDAIQGKADTTFQFHHQPFVYFKNFRDGSPLREKHLKDEPDFFNNLKEGKLPSVSFIKPLGRYNEHPEYSTVDAGQMHVDSLVKAIMNSKYWSECVIVLTYDENGGRWDHVAPPVIDRWGPGSRIPAVIVSPFAKKGFVDHTQYETVSILKFIESRYGLLPLSDRDAKANNLLNSFDINSFK